MIFCQLFKHLLKEIKAASMPRQLTPLLLSCIACVAAAESLPGQIPEPASTDIITALPRPAVQAVVAGDGRFLVLKLQDMKALYVYDVDERKISQIIALASDQFVYAAGGDIVLVGFYDSNILQTWNLRSGQKLKTKVNPALEVICDLSMGSANPQQALLRTTLLSTRPDVGNYGYSILDTKTLTLQQIYKSEGSGTPLQKTSIICGVEVGTNWHARSDSQMARVYQWRRTEGGLNFGCFDWENPDRSRAVDFSSQRNAADSAFGLYTLTGDQFLATLLCGQCLPRRRLVPGLGGRFFLAIDADGHVDLHAYGNGTAITHLAELPLALRDGDMDFLFDRHVDFDPMRGALVMIPPQEPNRIIQRQFDLHALLAQATGDVLVVSSAAPLVDIGGKPFTYAIQAWSNHAPIQYTLAGAPPGMTISPSGVIEWPVPHSGSGQERVKVMLRDSANKQMAYDFDLYVDQSLLQQERLKRQAPQLSIDPTAPRLNPQPLANQGHGTSLFLPLREADSNPITVNYQMGYVELAFTGGNKDKAMVWDGWALLKPLAEKCELSFLVAYDGSEDLDISIAMSGKDLPYHESKPIKLLATNKGWQRIVIPLGSNDFKSANSKWEYIDSVNLSTVGNFQLQVHNGKNSNTVKISEWSFHAPALVEKNPKP